MTVLETRFPRQVLIIFQRGLTYVDKGIYNGQVMKRGTRKPKPATKAEVPFVELGRAVQAWDMTRRPELYGGKKK